MSAWFANDDSGADIRQRRLASGVHTLSLNGLDVDGAETVGWRHYEFVINHDPQTIILDGQTDWAHPEDPQAYPYYIELGDPAQVWPAGTVIGEGTAISLVGTPGPHMKPLDDDAKKQIEVAQKEYKTAGKPWTNNYTSFLPVA
jgi:hypothetical protein